MRTFGSQGQYAWQFSLTFPTGQYDAERGPDLSKNILPQNLQMGQGIYSAILGLFYTCDFEQGMLLFNGFFNYPFMMRFDEKNQYLDTDYAAYKDVTENKERFELFAWRVKKRFLAIQQIWFLDI